MEITPELVATVTLPAAPDGPVPGGTHRRRLVSVRTDTALTVHDLEDPDRPVVSFPAPWPPTGYAVDAVAPGLDLAVFSGLHAVRAVGIGGATRWEVPHGCWGCLEEHESAEEYRDDPEHEHPDHGSVAVDPSGATVWAHVRGPEDPEDTRGESVDELWLVIDAADGTVLAETALGTAAAGSHHVPHPDPAIMGLAVGEGQDGAPAFWAHRRGPGLHVDRLPGDDRILAGLGPGGRTYLTVGHARGTELTVHRLPDHTPAGTLFADPGSRWSLRCGPVDDRRVVAATSEKGHGERDVRHWLIDVPALERVAVRYPVPVTAYPIGLADGTWLTSSPSTAEAHVWRAP